MARKKVNYPPAKTSRQPPPPAGDTRPGLVNRAVSIDLNAMKGGSTLHQGDRVRIATGLYAGELATVESVVGGVIPAALVRTEAGRTRRVRAIDLVRDDGRRPEQEPPPATAG